MKHLVLAMAVLLLACGDPIVTGAYRGEALLTLEGAVLVERGEVGDDELESTLGTLRVSLFWSRHAGQQIDGPAVSPIEQQVFASAAFPARYALSIFRPPPDAVLVAPPDGEGRYAIALVLAYIDLDRDQRWTPRVDRLVGGARDRGVLYTPDGAQSAYFGDRSPGFHRIRIQPGSDPCFAEPHAQLHSDADLSLPIVVNAADPSTALIDVNCDGHHQEWDVCPSAEGLAEVCAEGTEDWRCRTCPVARGTEICPACGEDTPLCVGQRAVCDGGVATAADCLGHADACFLDGRAQADCLLLFDACQQAVGDNEPGTFATCGAYGDICLQTRDDLDGCRDHFVACAVAPG